ncbi:hypothetical protein [Dokdonella sp.]|uniref:hypothetical protein n=1 Tax=Dokdonella sp. TaxID=2291710 RepID=UPI00352902B1
MTFRFFRPIPAWAISLMLTFLPAPACLAADAVAAKGERGRITLHSTDKADGELPVTFGIPFAPGQLADAGKLRILDQDGNEVPAHVEETLRWHSGDHGIRAVRVQLRTTLKNGRRELEFSTEGVRSRELDGWPYAEGLVDAANHLRMPAVLATLEPKWLSRSLMAGPQVPFSTDNAYDTYVETQYGWAGKLPAADSTAWLFDRPTTLFKLYVRSGKIEHLRSAVESYRFYMGHIKRSGECAGGWEFGRAKPCDAKYVYVEPSLLALGLTGDDSLYTPELIDRMMALWDTGGWSGIGGPYRSPDQNFTERHIGLGLIETVAAFELTGKPEYRKRIAERIGWLHEHQENNPDLLGKDGSWRHSWQRHEGASYDVATDVRGASPWMSENIIDGLWHAWLVTADPRIPGMMVSFGRYLEEHGWITKETFKLAGHSWRDDCSGEDGQIAWYWSSSQASMATLIRMQDEGGEYSDSHTVQLALPVAAARYFETDPAWKSKFDKRLELIAHSYAVECARTSSTARRFNWNNRGAGTVQWMLKNFDSAPEPGIPARPK